MKTTVPLILLLAGLTTISCTSTSDSPSGIGHIIVIGVDGLSPDGIQKTQTPVLDSLINSGAVHWKVRSVLPSSSSQNWASILMGAGPEVHGITDNDWELEDHSLPPVIQEKDGRFPSIFSVLKKQDPDAETGAIYHWAGFGRLFQQDAVNFNRSFSTEDSASSAFCSYILEKKPRLAVLHLDHVDHAGHQYGHGSEGYYESIAKTDSLIAQITDAVRQAGISDQTLIMIVSDHGGVGYGHGGLTTAEAETALILSGAGVKPGYEIKQEVYVYDYAATIAFALGVTPPYAWTGRPVKPAFTGFSEPSNNWQGLRQIAAPVIHPEKKLYQKAGGIFIDRDAVVRITPATTDYEIRYTLDGTPPDASSPLYTEPVTLRQTTLVKAKSFDKNGNESPVSTGYFRVVKSGKGHGVTTSFFRLDKPQKLPVFARLKKEATWTDNEITTDHKKIDSLMGHESKSFGLVTEGYLQIDTPGDYTFYTQSDDGSKLFIANNEIVDNDGSHGVVEQSGKVKLEAGRHPIRVEYFNGIGSGWLEAYYKGPDIAKQLIPADRLFISK